MATRPSSGSGDLAHFGPFEAVDSEALISTLDDDLTVASEAVTAMTALRQRSGEGAGEARIASACDALSGYLTEVARLTRSTLTLHLALEAHLYTDRD